MPFETAQQLKNAGYPQYDVNRTIMCGDDYYYENNSGILSICGYALDVNGIHTYPENRLHIEDYTVAPKYCEAIDWLEKERDISVNAFPYYNTDTCSWKFQYFIFFKELVLRNEISEKYPSREKALNAGILRAIKMFNTK